MQQKQIQPSSVTEDYSPARRAFHLAVIYLLGAVIGLALAIPTIMYLLVPGKRRQDSNFIDVGDISQLQPNQPMEFSFEVNRVDGWKVINEKRTTWVVKGADNKVVAFGPQCTHLGCAYHVENGQFLCPCHTSVFSFDGKVVSGPAPRPLDRYELKISNNRLALGELKESNG